MIVTKEMGTILEDTTMESSIWLNVKNEPFKVYGLLDGYIRVPDDIGEKTSDNVNHQRLDLAGGRIRFKTDSTFISIHIDRRDEDRKYFTPGLNKRSDIYCVEDGKQKFVSIIYSSQDWENKGEVKKYVEGRVQTPYGMKEYIINLPNFISGHTIYVGLSEGCNVEAGTEYEYTNPIVFYGSSIVHGARASRPGAAYPTVVSRLLNTDFYNIGFGAGAMAEEILMDYIAGREMSIFVYDYDHNAPNVEHLEKTHYRGYEIFRQKQPNTPVVMASKVDYCLDPVQNEIRRQIIINSYNKAISNGDKNVYFIDGKEIFGEENDHILTYEGCHPNDGGYARMGIEFSKVLKPLLKK